MNANGVTCKYESCEEAQDRERACWLNAASFCLGAKLLEESWYVAGD